MQENNSLGRVNGLCCRLETKVRPFYLFHKLLYKLKQAGQNLSQVFNFRYERAFAPWTLFRTAKLPNSKWKAQTKQPGNTKGGSITVLLTSCLTDLELVVWVLTSFVLICKTDYSKQVKPEVNGTVILPPLVFPAFALLGKLFSNQCLLN